MECKDYKKYILTPENRTCFAKKVKQVWGNVSDAENILNSDSSTAVLSNSNGEKPKILLDLGSASPGGYPVFKVKAKKGTPVIRISYSDWYDYIVDPDHGENGDFIRGCCKYLGVELPVLPGNPNRFETYTITRTGEYMYPLIQGQQRWVMICLETADTEVEIEYFYIHYTSDIAPHDGHFLCSDEDLNKLWYSSTWTCQIASFNAQAWDTLNGKLFVRALTKGNPAGTYKKGYGWDNYTVEFDCEIAKNPQCVSGVLWMVRANQENGYVFNIDLDGLYRKYVRENKVLRMMGTEQKLEIDICDNMPIHIKTEVAGNCIAIFVNGVNVDEFTDDRYSVGSIGFCQTTEKWAMVSHLHIYNEDKTLLEDDFEGGLDDYDFVRTPAFLSDGAKRDRLPWSGDLDWAGRNIYYAFRNSEYMPNTLKMHTENQTPEGYVWGTFYPENDVKPSAGEYGYYQSDIFSAWLIPPAADYLLYTGDIETIKQMYRSITDDLDYLYRFVEGDGLFTQRYATSKGLWDHMLNDMGKFAYNNIVMHYTFLEGAYIAKKLGKPEDEREFLRRAEVIRSGIMANLWNEENGYLQKSTIDSGMCPMANSMALAVEFFTKEQAKTVVEALIKDTPGHGKITALMIRGCYIYGLEQEAINTIFQPGYTYVDDSNRVLEFDPLLDPNFNFAENKMHPANWIKALNDWRGPMTTWECMHYPPFKEAKGNGWGDRSHPDTAIAHILSGYILGVMPTDMGFSRFRVQPFLSNLKYAKGVVPTALGDIEVSWALNENKLILDISFAGENQLDEIVVNKEYADTIIVNVNGVRVQQAKEQNGTIYFTDR